MTIEERERMLRLQLAEMQGVIPETEYKIDVTHTEECGTLIDSTFFYAQIQPHYYTGKPALSVKTHPHAMEIERVEELIALLQRARAIMAGGT